MQVPDTAAQWTKYWLYDWGGANLDLFFATQRFLSDGLLWAPEILSMLGSYWGAPAVGLLMLVWRRAVVRQGSTALEVPLYRFAFGLPLAIAVAASFKAFFALPRPFVVMGAAVYRAQSAPDSRYTMPSGHAVYVGVLAAALWPSLGWVGRVGLLVFAAAVCWSRVVLGAHFPTDVVAGLALGWACVAATGSGARRVARYEPITGRHL